MTKFAKAHEYATRNGFRGSLAEYVTLQYQGYVLTLARLDIAPMTRQEWDAAQVAQLAQDIAQICEMVEGASEQDARDYLEQFGTVSRAVAILRDDLGCNEIH